MAYKRIYSPSGEPFDVPENRANDLILQSGWTQQPHTPVKKEKAKPKRRRSNRDFVEAVVESVEETVEDVVDVETESDKDKDE